jgi:GGDEF domain-containing protein
MGGDEFVVLAPDIQRSALEENVQRFRDAVERTGVRLGYSGLSSSIGAVVFVPGEGDVDADTLLAEADRKMYANKRRAKALAAGRAEAEKPHHRGHEKATTASLDLFALNIGAGDDGASAETVPAVIVH